ncbi:MAG: hypothetical protein KBS59_03980, partial [Clostridiales bacterium]|nr:hypothetical protein [Clostridiales bacterium]
IYTFVLLTGFFSGFAVWWLPYLYIWLPLWAVTMFLSKRLPPKKHAVLYMLISAAHGLLYGTLYAPAQALLFGLDFKSTVAWIIAGLPWDAVHGAGNFVAGILIVPLISIMEICERTSKKE